VIEGKEYIVSSSNDILEKIRIINTLTIKGMNNPKIIEFANECKNSKNPIRCAFDKAYQLAVFRSSPEDRQQFRSIDNIVRTRQANCTGYVEVIGAILRRLNIPYKLRVSGFEKNEFIHIYLIANGYILDCTLGQSQNNKDSFINRPLNGSFNKEMNLPHKKDFNMNTVLNGTRRTRRRNLIQGNLNLDPVTAAAIGEIAEGYKSPDGSINTQELTNDVKQLLSLGGYGINTLTDIITKYFNPCKRGCDIKYPFNRDMRLACKQDCVRRGLTELSKDSLLTIQNHFEPQLKKQQAGLGNMGNILLLGAVVSGAVYYATK
jgi:hypothetical protein